MRNLQRGWDRLNRWLHAAQYWADRQPTPLRLFTYALLLIALVTLILGPFLLTLAVNLTSSSSPLAARMLVGGSVVMLTAFYMAFFFANKPTKPWRSRLPSCVWLVVTGLTLTGELGWWWFGVPVFALGAAGIIGPTAMRWYDRRAPGPGSASGAQTR